MIGVQTNRKPLQDLAKLCSEAGRKLPKETAIAVNETVKRGASHVAKGVTEELAMTQKDVKKELKTSKATENNPTGIVTLRHSYRPGLRAFGAKQNARGVSYKISKKGGRGFVAGAFQGPRPGVMKISWRGNAFKRLGKSRLPIVKLHGASAWGSFKKNDKIQPSARFMQQELERQINKRLRYLKLKASGVIK